MSAEAPTPDPPRQISGFVLDTAAIVLFAAIGRRSHDEASGVGAVMSTAAPFLIALLVAWGVAAIVGRSCADLRDPLSVEAGVEIWIVTVSLGLVARRVLWDRGTAIAFVIVAVIVLGALLVGWRVLRRWRTRQLPS